MYDFYASNSIIPNTVFAFLHTHVNSPILHCIIAMSSILPFLKLSENIPCYIQEVLTISAAANIEGKFKISYEYTIYPIMAFAIPSPS